MPRNWENLTPSQIDSTREALQAVLAQRRLKHFVEFAWSWIEPREFRDNWHIDVICEHLEAVNRGDIKRLLINIPPRHGKPVHVDELVATDRSRTRLGDIRVGDMVLTHRGRFRRVEAVHEQGVLPVLKITTHCGRVVRANDEHPFLTPRGWIQAQHLTTDDVLAAVVPAQECGVPMRPEIGFTAKWIDGNGDVLKPDPIVSIERDKPAECRCLTVDEDHSFTVQDIAVHNSLIFAVFWPVWTWLQDNMEKDGDQLPTIGRGTRFLFASYSERLSLRDSVRCRNIIRHPVFQRHYDIKMLQDTKIRFDIDGGGYRVSTSVKGLATGEGGDIIGIDDPHNVKQGESETIREETVRWFAEVLPTRFNDQRYGAMGVIMQRVHERDVSGYILAEELGYTHLCLPARFERNHPYPCKADIRKKDGELLWKGFIGEQELANIEKPLGKYASAGQLQQRPAPREGGMFERHWLQIVNHLPERRIRVRAWDIAGSVAEYDPDWTVGVLMSRCDQGYYWIEDVVRFRATSLNVFREQKACAELDGRRTVITVPQDPGSAGKHHAEAMVRNLAGFLCKIIRPSGDKETRAKAFAAQAEAGNVRLVKAHWNNEFINELCSFPNGRFNDQVDAAADAFNELSETLVSASSKPMRW